MSTLEVPRNDWIAFLDGFSRQHHGWLVTIEVHGASTGAQVQARELALRGITAERQSGGEDRISITLSKTPEARPLHLVITSPVHVRLEQTEEGAHKALEIESASGETTRLRFHSAVRPETVDGILLE